MRVVLLPPVVERRRGSAILATLVVLFVVSVIPVAQLFLQRREPDWLVAVPVSGQYLLLNRALRGEAIAAGDLALSCVLPIVLVALAWWAIARRYADESMLAGK